MSIFPNHLEKKLNERINNNSFRVLTNDKNKIDFSSNDYLGFSQNIAISKKSNELCNSQIFKNGSTGSRLVSGTHDIHLETENLIADFHNAESGLLFNSGYDANIGLFSCIAQKGDTIIFDELIHASIRDGIRLSNAKSFKFKHNNTEDLEKKIKKAEGTVYIAIETIYSMDGDSAPLQSIVNLCNQYQCLLIVDEAHSNGVFGEQGKGTVQQLGLEHQIFARVHTFGKALGCHGAIILGSNELRNYLINFSRSFIYTTAAAAHSIATIQAAYLELQTTPELKKLQGNIAYFKKGVSEKKLDAKFVASNSAIHCCIIPGNDIVKAFAQKLQQNEFDIKAILSPTVSKGQERLRICIHSYNTQQEIDALLTALATL